MRLRRDGLANARVLVVAAAVVVLIAVTYLVNPRSARPDDTPSQTMLTTTTTTTTTPTPKGDTVTDIDGNVYRTVQIGSQTWMAENLRVTKYNEGEAIPLVTSGYTWGNLRTAAYCYYKNDPSYNLTLGALYNWYTVETGRLAPPGWHVPTNEDWEILSEYLGGDAVTGGKLKKRGTAHWLNPNTGATDQYGFTAYSSSTQNYDGYQFYVIGDGCYFWSSIEYDASNAWVRQLICDSAALKSFNASKNYGRSIRLVKDSTP